MDNDYTQIEFLKNVDDAKNIINTVFSNGYVRRYPFYILTILQNLQQGDTERLLFSSYGHYYEVLFRTAIKRLVISNDNIEAFFQFLPELANYYFRKRITSLTILDFEKFRSWYCKEYKISPAMKLIYDREALSNTLSEASMIKIEHDEVKFAAKSVYYFFLARYMADNLEKDIIKDQISNICKRLYRDDFANIILFLVHHTRNEFVINEILVNSKKIFSTFEPINLESDIKSINVLMDEIPKLVIREKNFREHRHEIDEIKDKVEAETIENGFNSDNQEDILDPSEEIIELDMPAQMGLSLRIIEILGLILKNHHSSLKGDIKFNLANEAFALGLRTITPIYSFLENNKQLVVNNLASLIIQKGFIDENHVKKESEKYLFFVCFLLAYAYINHISDSVGNENLSETFKDIMENNTKLSYAITDAAIKLDCSKGFSTPIKELDSLNKRLVTHKKVNRDGKYIENREIRSLLPYYILVQLVEDYCNLYPISDFEKQHFSSLFDISMERQNLYKIAYFNRNNTQTRILRDNK